MAPQVGLEPTTLRLTAECSAIELLRNMKLCSLENVVIILHPAPLVNPCKTLFHKKILFGAGQQKSRNPCFIPLHNMVYYMKRRVCLEQESDQL